MKSRQRLALVKAANESVERKANGELKEGVRPKAKQQPGQAKVAKHFKQSVTLADISAGTSSSSPGRQHWQSDQQDDEACSIMMSPFEKKLYLRQEDLLCSQAVDSQCEVRWDCTSPDAIRHLKKIRKCRNGQDSMSDLVLRFLDDNGEVSNNTPPLLSLWMESKLVNNTNGHIPGQCVERERKNHSTRRRRRPTGNAEDEAKALVQRMIERCEVIEKSADINKNGNQITTGDSGPMNTKSTKSEKKQETESTHSNNVEMKSIISDKSSDSDQKNTSDDNIWTDDDLFEDSSFILEATQLPVGKRKLDSTVGEQPNMKNKRYTFSLTADSDIIPPSLATSSEANKSVGKSTYRQNVKNIYQPTAVSSKNICQPSVGTSKNNHPTTCTSNNIKPTTCTSKNMEPVTCTSKKYQPVTCVSKNFQPTTYTSKTFEPITCASKNIYQSSTCTSQKPCQSTTNTSKTISHPVSYTSKNVYESTTCTLKNVSKTSACTSASGAVKSGSVNSNSFKKHNSFDDKLSFSTHSNQQSCSKTDSPNVGSSKSPWRRCSSFSGSQSLSNPPQRQPSCTVSRSEAVSKGPRHVAEINNNLNTTSLSTVGIPQSCQQKISATSGNGISRGAPLCTSVKKVSPDAHLVNKIICLDTSITDELLCQLAEPDEVLESQLTPDDVAALSQLTDELCRDDLFADEMDDVATLTKTVHTKAASNNVNSTASNGVGTKTVGNSVTKRMACDNVNTKMTSNIVKSRTGENSVNNRMPSNGKNAGTASSNVSKKPTCNSVSTKMASNSINTRTVVNTGTSSVKSVGGRDSFSLRGNECNPTFRGKALPHAAGGETTHSGSGHISARTGTEGSGRQQAKGKFSFKSAIGNPNSSAVSVMCSVNQNTRSTTTVPDEKAPKDATAEVTKTNGCELDSGQGIDDDSFLGDDALFESQIMALLDQVESQESVQVSQLSSNKCTSTEIERKRLAALEKQKQKKTHPA